MKKWMTGLAALMILAMSFSVSQAAMPDVAGDASRTLNSSMNAVAQKQHDADMNFYRNASYRAANEANAAPSTPLTKAAKNELSTLASAGLAAYDADKAQSIRDRAANQIAEDRLNNAAKGVPVTGAPAGNEAQVQQTEEQQRKKDEEIQARMNTLRMNHYQAILEEMEKEQASAQQQEKK